MHVYIFFIHSLSNRLHISFRKLNQSKDYFQKILPLHKFLCLYLCPSTMAMNELSMLFIHLCSKSGALFSA